jgi:hypothetical protein
LHNGLSKPNDLWKIFLAWLRCQKVSTNPSISSSHDSMAALLQACFTLSRLQILVSKTSFSSAAALWV